MSSKTVEEIKDKLGIVELLDSYLKIEKSGANFKARCPFHNEKTPSFFISPERNNYYCFGCGKKGDIFSFIEDFEGVDFIGALKILGERTGVQIEYNKSGEQSKRQKLFEILDKTTTWYEGRLKENKNVAEYLKNRGLNEKTTSEWRLGYSLPEWRATSDFLKSSGFPDLLIEEAGITKKGDKGNHYDRLRGRIIFPIFDASSRVVGFTGRILDGKPDDAKYINSPETDLFNKSKVLYGFNFAKTSIRKNNFSIMVEGQMDVLMAHQAGYLNTVATSGTAITADQLDLLDRISNRLVIALDGDGAGFRASERAWKMALNRGMDVKIAIMPTGKDPADIISEDPNHWKEIIREAHHIVDYLITHLAGEGLDERSVGRRIHSDIIPYIVEIPSSIEQAHFIKTISSTFDIHEDALRKEIENTSINSIEKEVSNKVVTPKKEEHSLENRLIGIIIWQKMKEKPDVDVISLEKETIEILGNAEYDRILENSTEELAFQTEKYYENTKVLESETKELILNLKKLIGESKMKNLKAELLKVEKSGDETREQEILKEIQDISKMIHSTKS